MLDLKPVILAIWTTDCAILFQMPTSIVKIPQADSCGSTFWWGEHSGDVVVIQKCVYCCEGFFVKLRCVFGWCATSESEWKSIGLLALGRVKIERDGCEREFELYAEGKRARHLI